MLKRTEPRTAAKGDIPPSKGHIGPHLAPGRMIERRSGSTPDMANSETSKQRVVERYRRASPREVWNLVRHCGHAIGETRVEGDAEYAASILLLDHIE